MKIIVDTWGWVTLLNKREPAHRKVKALYNDLRKNDELIFVTNFILDETFTLFFKRMPFSIAKEAMLRIKSAIDCNNIHLKIIDTPIFEEAIEYRLKLQDKPDISFTDLTTMAVMDELQIKNILTGDSHFLHVGMGFNLRP
jgi:predicted nucleic acid-binding protein